MSTTARGSRGRAGQGARQRASLLSSPLRWALDRCFGLVMLAAIGLLISLAVEYVGLMWWWRDQGAAHAQGMLEAELRWLNGDFRTGIAGLAPLEMGSWLADVLYRYSGVQWLIQTAATPIDDRSFFSPVIRTVQSTVLALSEFVMATGYVVQLYGLRLVVVLFSLPCFALFGAVGLVDGLVQRDLRRFHGGVESAFLYHVLKRYLTPVIALAIVAYLSLPFSLHPNAIFVPAAVAFGVLVALTSARFKKFL